jgi:hypothetical protein
MICAAGSARLASACSTNVAASYGNATLTVRALGWCDTVRAAYQAPELWQYKAIHRHFIPTPVINVDTQIIYGGLYLDPAQGAANFYHLLYAELV